MSEYNNYIEKAENLTVPVVVLNGTVAFPSVNINFEVSEKESVAAAKAALETNSFVLLVTNKNSPAEYGGIDDLFSKYDGVTLALAVRAYHPDWNW